MHPLCCIKKSFEFSFCSPRCHGGVRSSIYEPIALLPSLVSSHTSLIRSMSLTWWFLCLLLFNIMLSEEWDGIMMRSLVPCVILWLVHSSLRNGPFMYLRTSNMLPMCPPLIGPCHGDIIKHYYLVRSNKTMTPFVLPKRREKGPMARFHHMSFVQIFKALGLFFLNLVHVGTPLIFSSKSSRILSSFFELTR